MKKQMIYKGYCAKIEYSEEDECLIGRVSGIRHGITFHGDSVKEIRQAFEEAVDVYIDGCTERNEEPEKPVADRSVVRMSPQLHRVLALAAKSEHKSINTWIAEIRKSKKE